jgi:hypothetical protein
MDKSIWFRFQVRTTTTLRVIQNSSQSMEVGLPKVERVKLIINNLLLHGGIVSILTIVMYSTNQR